MSSAALEARIAAARVAAAKMADEADAALAAAGEALDVMQRREDEAARLEVARAAADEELRALLEQREAEKAAQRGPLHYPFGPSELRGAWLAVLDPLRQRLASPDRSVAAAALEPGRFCTPPRQLTAGLPP